MHAYKYNTEKMNVLKCVARKFDFVDLRFDPLRQNS